MNRPLFIPALLFACLLLTSCEDAPWQDNFASKPPPPMPIPAGVEAGETIQTQQGDTVYSVARRYKVSMRDIIALNQLRPPYSLLPGSTLVLPAKEIMVTSLHRKPVKEKAAAPTPLLQEAEPPPPETEGATLYHQEASHAQMIDSGEPEKVIYAPAHQQELADLANESSKKPVIIEGRPGAPEQVNLHPLNYDQRTTQLSEASLHPPVFPKNRLMPPPTPAALRPAPGRFIWPVQGPVLSDYGPKGEGMRNDGLNIAAPLGTPVAASDGGTVAYAGSDIPGYGNVVLIRHPDGFMTTYAHLERIFVIKDTVVAKGDVLGTVGTSGGLTSPQLHFEIRKGAEAMDPKYYLPART